MNSPDENGPFGRYVRGALGHVLNALVRFGVPMRIVEALELIKDPVGQPDSGILMYCHKNFVIYRYFDGIDDPLFRFVDSTRSSYEQQRIAVDGNNKRAEFRLSLSHQGTPGLIIHGDLATPGLHRFVKEFINDSLITSERYRIRQEAGAFFQGGSDCEDGQRIYVEFWKPQGAQKFVDYINENYVPE